MTYFASTGASFSLLPSAWGRAPATKASNGHIASQGTTQTALLHQLINGMTQRIQQASSLTDLLRSAAAVLAETLECDQVTISQRCNNGQRFRAIAHPPAESLALEACYRFTLGTCLKSSGDDRPRYLKSLDLVGFPPLLRRCLNLDQMHQGWQVPLQYNGQLWGSVMGFREGVTAPWPLELLPTLEVVANQLIVGIRLLETQHQLDLEQGQHQRLQTLLNHLQFRDALTGLPNRKQFMKELTKVLDGKLPRQSLAIILINIDRFQAINDSLGHDTGDQLLMEMSYRLQKQLGPDYTFAHWGEDKFAVLLRHLPAPERAMAIADQLRQAIALPFDCNQIEVVLTACIGVALNQPSYSTPELLIQAAETALHWAKSQGKGQILSFQTAMHDHVVTRLRLENALRKALTNQELVLHYQPIVTLLNGQLTGFEALVRWQHPVLGLISPAEFVPLAEETGLIVQLDDWCLQSACQQMRQWQDQWPDMPRLTMSVNLSSRQFTQPDLVQRVNYHLKTAGVEPSCLKLEITESTLIENMALAATQLVELQQLGVQVSMDDFGTGYSSLSYLHQFKLNTLKIDRSFIAVLEPKSEKAAIVQAIITLAHALDMDVVSEGVETVEQQNLLLAMGCEQGQGYLFSKPLTCDDATHLLKLQPSLKA
ncbi:GGDEF domain-containing response regulator [filamentous cyanobacterium CCP3]|nr:GGDEF domain-containing response regulator [filamentous cyanobacterium CCP3]